MTIQVLLLVSNFEHTYNLLTLNLESFAPKRIWITPIALCTQRLFILGL